MLYKDVYVPTPCNIAKPTRPPKDLGLLEYVKALLIYTEGLEKDLEFCSRPPRVNTPKGEPVQVEYLLRLRVERAS